MCLDPRVRFPSPAPNRILADVGFDWPHSSNARPDALKNPWSVGAHKIPHFPGMEVESAY
jgi:hypothetical protein